jgi:hypothetical protein
MTRIVYASYVSAPQFLIEARSVQHFWLNRRNGKTISKPGKDHLQVLLDQPKTFGLKPEDVAPFANAHQFDEVADTLKSRLFKTWMRVQFMGKDFGTFIGQSPLAGSDLKLAQNYLLDHPEARLKEVILWGWQGGQIFNVPYKTFLVADSLRDLNQATSFVSAAKRMYFIITPSGRTIGEASFDIYRSSDAADDARRDAKVIKELRQLGVLPKTGKFRLACPPYGRDNDWQVEDEHGKAVLSLDTQK